MKRPYVLSKGAAADIRDIAKYTATTWGEGQRRAYIAELEKSAEALAKGEGIFKDMSFVLHSRRTASEYGFDGKAQRQVALERLKFSCHFRQSQVRALSL
jgi:plasmid stabilization system protein ParE